MFTKGFWKWVLVGGLVSSTFLGAKAQSKQGEDTEDKEGKREGMVGKEEKEDSSERQWKGSGV